MKRLLLLIFTLTSFATYSQQLNGLVLDKSKQPVPFATVYFKGTSIGTSCNAEGEFTLNKVVSDVIIISSIGFEKKEVSVKDFASGKAKTIVLSDQTVELKAVTVSKKKRDPAYYIMKNAIKKRKYYLNQVKEYEAEIYMKGGITLDEIPKWIKVAVDDQEVDSSEIGLVFLSESASKMYYNKPDIKEEMIASKVSGTAYGGIDISWNRARDVLVSFYEGNVDMNINDRGFISPLSPNAMLYYDFKYLGFFNENNYIINKIQVTPKRKGDPVFEGKIYITEDLWNIHSVDLKVNKETQMQYLDSIKIQQNFQHLEGDIFMPVSLVIHYYYSILGIKATYRALGRLSDYNLHPNEKKETYFYKNETFKVSGKVEENQEEYWEKNRPTILTKDEVENYEEGDSILQTITSPTYIDSIDRVANKLQPTDLLFSGYHHRNSKDSSRWSVNSLLSAIQWTTVDGLALDIRPQWTKDRKTGYTRWKGELRYSNKQETVDATASWTKQFNKFSRPILSISGGVMTRQINNNEPIPYELNTYYTLFERKNYAQFYKDAYTSITYGKEYVNGIRLTTGIKFSHRESLSNQSDFSFKHKDSRNFTPNIPIPNTDAIILYGNARFAINQKYETYPDRKVLLRSKFPYLYLSYNYMPKLNGREFLQLQASVRTRVNLTLMGTTAYNFTAGFFPIKQNMNFVDFKHFNGNQTTFLNTSNSAFNLLNYYESSTNNKYVQLGGTHYFNGFLWNKLPLLRKLKWSTNIGARTLVVENKQPYIEASAGIENIFRILRVDVVTSFANNQWTAPILLLGINSSF